MTSAAVVLAVGARLCGQASCGTLTSRCTSAARASVETRIAGQGDQRHAQALDLRQQRQHFGGLAGVGQRQQHIARA